MRTGAGRRAVAGVLAATWLAPGCRSLVDPPLPTGAVAYTPPPIYARWWAMTAACSGQTRDMASISWYVVPGASAFPIGAQGEANGYYSAPGTQIVIAGGAELDGGVVRHEMLHALLRDKPGHPRAQFLERCAGVVTCANSCIEAPIPTPPSGTRSLPPTALVLSTEVSPDAPSATRDDGWFSVTVTAQNAGTTPILIAAIAQPGRTGFGLELTTDPRPSPGSATFVDRVIGMPAYDPSTYLFAPGESKRFVFDFHIGGTGKLGDRAIGVGRYALVGLYGDPGSGAAAEPVRVVLAP